jgi:hypothetical protein
MYKIWKLLFEMHKTMFKVSKLLFVFDIINCL